VVGVSLGDSAKAYPFDTVSQDVVVNDHVGDVPVMVYANPEDKSVHIFVRRVGESTLDFTWTDGKVVDQQTGTVWNQAKGLAVGAPSEATC
jgi:hypothetical protein